MRRPGRKHNPNAKRNQTTLAGRGKIVCVCRTRDEWSVCDRRNSCPGPDLVIEGQTLRKRELMRLTDIELSPLGILYGRGVIDQQSFDAGCYYGAIRTLFRKGWSLSEGTCEAIYQRMVAGGIDDNSGGRYVSGDIDRPTLADVARGELDRHETEAGLTRTQRGFAGRIADGQFLDVITKIANRTYDARFSPATETTPLVQIAGQPVGRDNMKTLGRLADIYVRLARVEPRLKAASLAA